MARKSGNHEWYDLGITSETTWLRAMPLNVIWVSKYLEFRTSGPLEIRTYKYRKTIKVSLSSLPAFWLASSPASWLSGWPAFSMASSPANLFIIFCVARMNSAGQIEHGLFHPNKLCSSILSNCRMWYTCNHTSMHADMISFSPWPTKILPPRHTGWLLRTRSRWSRFRPGPPKSCPCATQAGH